MADQSMSLEELIRDLSPELREQVREFTQYLVDRKTGHSQIPLDLGLRGILSDLLDQYTSVELQHKLAEWRDSDAA